MERGIKQTALKISSMKSKFRSVLPISCRMVLRFIVALKGTHQSLDAVYSHKGLLQYIWTLQHVAVVVNCGMVAACLLELFVIVLRGRNVVFGGRGDHKGGGRNSMVRT